MDIISQELKDFLSKDRDIPINLLRELFNYDSKTGLLTWRVTYKNSFVAGESAGCFIRGYYKVVVSGKAYFGHRLIWALCNGRHVQEGMVIDHINGNPSDNKIDNLRELSMRHNAQNRQLKKEGLPLYIYRHRKKFAVRIKTDKFRSYGSYFSVEEALERRDQLIKDLKIDVINEN